MTREELIQSKEYWIAKLQVALFNEVEAYMKEHKLTRTQFADKLGVSKGYVSQILNGEADHRISKFIELTLSIGLVPSISFEDIKVFLQREENGAFNISVDEIQRSKDILSRSGYLFTHKPINRYENCLNTEKNGSSLAEIESFKGQIKTPIAS